MDLTSAAWQEHGMFPPPGMEWHGIANDSSHLVVGGDHTYRHSVGISTDSEGIPTAVCYRGYILIIA